MKGYRGLSKAEREHREAMYRLMRDQEEDEARQDSESRRYDFMQTHKDFTILQADILADIQDKERPETFEDAYEKLTNTMTNNPSFTKELSKSNSFSR